MSTFRFLTPFDHVPTGVKRLLLACCGVYILQIFMYPFFMRFFALTPIKVLTKFMVWQLVTYSFIHGNIWHLLFNMFALWMIGTQVEYYWGTRTFLRYYFLCVVGAGLTQMIIAPRVSVVGSSGGIYGLLLAFGFLFPDAIIYLFFVFPLRAIQAVAAIALITLLSSLNTGGSQMAHFAHLGGMLTGFLYFKYPVWSRRWDGNRWTGIWGRLTNRYRKPRLQVLADDNPAQIDKILDKITVHGVESLTEEETAFMKRYSQKIK